MVKNDHFWSKWPFSFDRRGYFGDDQKWSTSNSSPSLDPRALDRSGPAQLELSPQMRYFEVKFGAFWGKMVILEKWFKNEQRNKNQKG